MDGGIRGLAVAKIKTTVSPRAVSVIMEYILPTSFHVVTIPEVHK